MINSQPTNQLLDFESRSHWASETAGMTDNDQLEGGPDRLSGVHCVQAPIGTCSFACMSRKGLTTGTGPLGTRQFCG